MQRNPSARVLDVSFIHLEIENILLAEFGMTKDEPGADVADE